MKIHDRLDAAEAELDDIKGIKRTPAPTTKQVVTGRSSGHHQPCMKTHMLVANSTCVSIQGCTCLDCTAWVWGSPDRP